MSLESKIFCSGIDQLNIAYQLTGIFPLTIFATKAVVTQAFVAAVQVLTTALLTGIVHQTLVDVKLANFTSETSAFAVTLVGIEQICTLAAVAGIVSTFINIFLAISASVARWASARVGLNGRKVERIINYLDTIA